MSLEELESRVQAFEDLEALKKLKARYAQICDDQYNPEDIAKLFTEDAKFIIKENGVREQYEGRDAIKNFFAGVSKRITFAIHYFMNPHIEVKGSKAEGLWYLWCPATLADGQCVLIAATEEDKYKKVNGKWLIAQTKIRSFFRAPYGKGWQTVSY